MTRLIILFALSFSFLFPADRFLHWQADQPLSWEDFQGTANPNSEMLAKTISALNYSTSCKEGTFHVKVTTRFDRERSWKKDGASDKLLAHEQLHFDITEVYGRKLHKTLTNLEDACQMSSDEIKAVAGEVREQWKSTQDRYDLETNHSNDREAQLRWERKVHRALENMPADKGE